MFLLTLFGYYLFISLPFFWWNEMFLSVFVYGRTGTLATSQIAALIWHNSSRTLMTSPQRFRRWMVPAQRWRKSQLDLLSFSLYLCVSVSLFYRFTWLHFSWILFLFFIEFFTNFIIFIHFFKLIWFNFLLILFLPTTVKNLR